MLRARLVRLFWIAAAALLCVAALVALVALLRGRFTQTDGRILQTLAVLFLAGSAAIAGYALVERRTLALLGRIAVATTLPGFAVIATALWSDSHGRLAGTALVVLVAELVLATNALLLRDRRFTLLVAATGIAATLTALFVIVTIWSRNPGSDLGRTIGAFAILTGLGYLLTPVLQRFAAAPARGESAEPVVLATLDSVELVSSREPVEGVEVTARPPRGERLILRRRRA